MARRSPPTPSASLRLPFRYPPPPRLTTPTNNPAAHSWRAETTQEAGLPLLGGAELRLTHRHLPDAGPVEVAEQLGDLGRTGGDSRGGGGEGGSGVLVCRRKTFGVHYVGRVMCRLWLGPSEVAVSLVVCVKV